MSNAIITSPSAARMVGTVSPVYDESIVAAWLFEVMGRELDGGWTLVDALPTQCSPYTCTWAMALWEEKYGLIPAPTLTLAQRRARLLSATGMRGAVNPAKLAAIVAQAAGINCTVVENVTLYSFRLKFDWLVVDPDAVRALVARVKPTHLSYEITYELNSNGPVHTIGTLGMGGDIALTEVTA